MLQLTKVFRQKDQNFKNLLNNIRVGKNLKKTIDEINKACIKKATSTKDHLTLTTRTENADIINRQRLSKLKGEELVYSATHEGDYFDHKKLDKQLPAPRELILKKNSRVIFVKNNGWVELNTWIKSALLFKNATIRWKWVESFEYKVEEYENLTSTQLDVITAEDDVEIIELITASEIIEGEEVEYYELAKIRRKIDTSKIELENIPPESFMINRTATSIANSTFVGIQTEVSLSDLRAQGFDVSDDLATEGSESFAGLKGNYGENANRQSINNVWVGEEDDILGAANREITVSNLPSKEDSIGHEVLLDMLPEIGLRLNQNTLVPSEMYSKVDINLVDANDLLPPLSAILALTGGGTISGAPHAMFKESNRIDKTAEMLHQFGIDSVIKEDGITIKGNQSIQKPVSMIQTFGDHRLQMTAIILATKVGAIVEGKNLHQIADPKFLERLSTMPAEVLVERVQR